MTKTSRFKRIIQKLRYKYRLAVTNENTFEEHFSFRLSRLNLFVAIALLSAVMIAITVFVIAFTPLREYIPGYGNVKEKELLYSLSIQADSLQEVVNARDEYFKNLYLLMLGIDSAMLYEPIDNSVNTPKVGNSESKIQTGSKENQSAWYISPVRGKVINGYNIGSKHCGIDIAGEKNAVIQSIADGIVVISQWTLDEGYVIAIQHSNNVISVYKHNAALLRQEGSRVETGEEIAIIGNTGENSSGPHLHFELWMNGAPVNPSSYILFE